MGDTTFWNLRSPESTARLADTVEGEVEDEQVLCPIDEGHRRAGKRLTNLNIVLPGVDVQDFVWTWLSKCLFQDHVLELFKARGFTGFDVKPVKAKFKRDSSGEPFRLWELVVTGWAGMAPGESGIKLEKHCDRCGLLRYSACSNPEKLINVSQWDGSDFFMVWPLPKYVFVTDRVARAIRDRGFKGAVLKRPRDVRSLQDGGFGPGRLSYWMPRRPARSFSSILGRLGCVLELFQGGSFHFGRSRKCKRCRCYRR